MYVVINMESEPPVLLGTFDHDDEDAVIYYDTAGETHVAPQDCVKVVKVTV